MNSFLKDIEDYTTRATLKSWEPLYYYFNKNSRFQMSLEMAQYINYFIVWTLEKDFMLNLKREKILNLVGDSRLIAEYNKSEDTYIIKTYLKVNGYFVKRVLLKIKTLNKFKLSAPVVNPDKILLDISEINTQLLDKVIELRYNEKYVQVFDYEIVWKNYKSTDYSTKYEFENFDEKMCKSIIQLIEFEIARLKTHPYIKTNIQHISSEIINDTLSCHFLLDKDQKKLAPQLSCLLLSRCDDKIRKNIQRVTVE